jgi:pectin methylesterase-like acyl-CoA thioesterase
LYSSQLGSTSITITVVSASIGDVVYVKNGVYRETLPLRVPAGVTVKGESLRGTEIRPASGTGHQVATITVTRWYRRYSTEHTIMFIGSSSNSLNGNILL